MEWISVNDRLPDYQGSFKEHLVIVSGIDDDGEIYVYYASVYAYGKENEVFSVPGWSDMNVTHWMPMPPHPEYHPGSSHDPMP